MTPEFLRRYGLIGSVILAMIFFVFIFGRLLLPGDDTTKNQTIGKNVERPVQPDEDPLRDGPLPFSLQRWKQDRMLPSGNRDLETFYGRRQYPGSPPRIPHPVSETQPTGDDQQCASCHVEGGYVEKYEAYAPRTPHPHLTACQQCHVPQRTGDLFRRSDWKSVRPPDLGQSALPGSPPPIPHRLQLRRNCNDCHAGPAAVSAIKTDHPERSYCVQCHVPQATDRGWSRSDND